MVWMYHSLYNYSAIEGCSLPHFLAVKIKLMKCFCVDQISHFSGDE